MINVFYVFTYCTRYNMSEGNNRGDCGSIPTELIIIYLMEGGEG